MTVYWLMFFIPICFSFYFSHGKDVSRDFILRVIVTLFVFFVGFRFEVGGDWSTYFDYYQDIAYSPSFSFESLSALDPGYVLVEYLSALLGMGIYGVNLVCGALMMSGIYYFCRRQPQPFLALTIAVPYLIIVIGMGYSRQAVALGFELLALIALTDRRFRHFLLWVICAALFHKTAILIAIIGVLSAKDKSIGKTLVMLTVYIILAWKFLNAHAENFLTNYVESEMVSEGAFIRVIMNAVPAVFFFIFAKRLTPDDEERKVWLWIALFSLACLPVVNLATTAIDRMALYFLPIQLYVYSRLGYLFSSLTFRFLSTVTVISFYAASLFLLLNYGAMVKLGWIPYNNIAL